MLWYICEPLKKTRAFNSKITPLYPKYYFFHIFIRNDNFGNFWKILKFFKKFISIFLKFLELFQIVPTTPEDPIVDYY